MTNLDPVLLVEGLSVRRGERLAVEQVSFQLARETDTALVGPNVVPYRHQHAGTRGHG
jgi:ABC-type branched-subunit amino acid transport system ATPase component